MSVEIEDIEKSLVFCITKTSKNITRDTVIIPVVKYDFETWILSKYGIERLRVAEKSSENYIYTPSEYPSRTNKELED